MLVFLTVVVVFLFLTWVHYAKVKCDIEAKEDTGKAQVAKGRGGRRREGICSDRARWEAEGRHRQRLGEVGGGVKA